MCLSCFFLFVGFRRGEQDSKSQMKMIRGVGEEKMGGVKG